MSLRDRDSACVTRLSLLFEKGFLAPRRSSPTLRGVYSDYTLIDAASLPEVLELVIAEQHGRHRRPGESGGVAFLRRQVRGTFMGLFQATKGSRQQPVAVSGWSAAVDRTC